MAENVRWGVLGTAKIALVHVVPGMRKPPYNRHIEIAAIASRDAQRAEAAASQLSIPKAYGSYEQLLADADIDAVYIPLPNHLHVPLSIKALDAGKHVLCEKPLGLSSKEAQLLVEAGKKYPHLKLMEAFMYRHHPQWQRARQLVREGGIGTLETIQTLFSYCLDDPDNIRNRPEYGGGGLLDIGCYAISLSRYLFEAEPDRVFGSVSYNAKLGVDELASAVMKFGSGMATFTCGTRIQGYQTAQILGTTGRVEIEIPFNAPADRPCRLWHETEDGLDEVEFDICDQYGIQGELFSRAILENTPVPTPIEDGVANLKVIEAVVRSEKTGGWESV